MYHNRRLLLKGLLGAPFFAKNILHASTQGEHVPSSRSHSGSASHTSTSSTLCVHFEGVFGYLVYSNHIEVFTPNLPSEHEYCFGIGGPRLYGYPQMDIDLQDVLPNVGGTFHLNDKTNHIILDKTAAGITAPDFTNRYWRIEVPIPSDITAEGTPSVVKQPFKGKHAPLVSQMKQVQTSYRFSYDLNDKALKKLHLTPVKGSGGCLLELRYCVAPKSQLYQHAVTAFHALRLMLPGLDLDLKDDIGFAKLTAKEMKSRDVYVMDGHLYLCTAPPIFVTGM
jgi:hypothetical protein